MNSPRSCNSLLVPVPIGPPYDGPAFRTVCICNGSPRWCWCSATVTPGVVTGRVVSSSIRHAVLARHAFVALDAIVSFTESRVALSGWLVGVVACRVGFTSCARNAPATGRVGPYDAFVCRAQLSTWLVTLRVSAGCVVTGIIGVTSVTRCARVAHNSAVLGAENRLAVSCSVDRARCARGVTATALAQPRELIAMSTAVLCAA
jgi:hypothetical protein